MILQVLSGSLQTSGMLDGLIASLTKSGPFVDLLLTFFSHIVQSTTGECHESHYSKSVQSFLAVLFGDCQQIHSKMNGEWHIMAYTVPSWIHGIHRWFVTMNCS